MSRFTVDDSEDAPEQKDDEQSDRFLALCVSHSLDEDHVQTERRQHDDRVEYLTHAALTIGSISFSLKNLCLDSRSYSDRFSSYSAISLFNRF